jgi:DNA segregation ATPase FtsK/SpoIIIE, S-DNA-T family
MPRGRRKKFKLKLNVRTETLRSIIATVFILSSGLTFVSLLFSGYTVNSKIQELLRSGFGYTHILLIPIFLLFGMLLLDSFKKFRFVEVRILLGFILLLFGASGLAHIPHRKAALTAAQDGLGGGFVGYKIINTLEPSISIYGVILILLAITIVAVTLIADKTLDEILIILKDSGAKLGLSSIVHRNATAQNEDDMEIRVGESFNSDDSDDDDELDGYEAPAHKPSFEIIPNPAEPQTQSSAASLTGMDGSSVQSLAPGLPYSNRVWELPPLDLLSDPPNTPADRGDVKQRAKIIEETLGSFGIIAKVRDKRFGPSVTQYALEAQSGTKIAKISNLQYDLALALASPTGSVRIEAPIPGRPLIGIEVPNNSRPTVYFKGLLTSEPMKNIKSKIAIVLGLDVGGDPLVYNIAKMPHLLIAGATGSGKSVFIHSIMASILFRASPQEVKFLLIDPKRVELVHYNGIPHLLAPVITDIEKAATTFKWLVAEMERRYKLLETAKVRNIEGYNEKSGFQALPYIILVVDELAEIMVTDPAAVEKSIIRLAQLARATGIHLVLALQRPSTNVITGLIKANIPCRIAFNVTSQVDSRVVIDQPGAEKLLGGGDMLFVPPDDSKPVRIQGVYVSDKEINNTVNFLKSLGVEPNYTEDIFNVPDTGKSISAGGEGVDPLYEEATDIIVAEGKGSASLLQRRLSIGYSRAARILDELEAKGVVGPARGSKPRKVLINNPHSSLSEFEDEDNEKY